MSKFKVTLIAVATCLSLSACVPAPDDTQGANNTPVDQTQIAELATTNAKQAATIVELENQLKLAQNAKLESDSALQTATAQTAQKMASLEGQVRSLESQLAEALQVSANAKQALIAGRDALDVKQAQIDAALVQADARAETVRQELLTQHSAEVANLRAQVADLTSQLQVAQATAKAAQTEYERIKAGVLSMFGATNDEVISEPAPQAEPETLQQDADTTNVTDCSNGTPCHVEETPTNEDETE